jgi:hypothetical protein
LTGQGEMYAEGSNAHDGSTPNQDKELEKAARRIQAMFDRGLIKINQSSENGAQSVLKWTGSWIWKMRGRKSKPGDRNTTSSDRTFP